ncbi:MAG: hypothetical protein ACYDB7_04145 [Mycobacteriales bacterium]
MADLTRSGNWSTGPSWRTRTAETTVRPAAKPALAVTAAILAFVGAGVFVGWFLDRGVTAHLKGVITNFLVDSLGLSGGGLVTLAVVAVGGGLLVLLPSARRGLGAGLLAGCAVLLVPLVVRYAQDVLLLQHAHETVGLLTPGSAVVPFLLGGAVLVVGAALALLAARSTAPRANATPVALALTAGASVFLAISLLVPEFAHSLDINSGRGVGGYVLRHHLAGALWLAVALVPLLTTFAKSAHLRFGVLMSLTAVLGVSVATEFVARNAATDSAGDGFGIGLGLRLVAVVLLVLAVVLPLSLNRSQRDPL